MIPCLVLTLSVLCFVFGCGPEIKVWTETYPKGEVREEHQYYNDPDLGIRVKDGWYNTYLVDGSPITVGHYKEDKRHGRWIEYDYEGGILSDGEYRDGIPWMGTILSLGGTTRSDRPYPHTDESFPLAITIHNFGLDEISTYDRGELHGDYIQLPIGYRGEILKKYGPKVTGTYSNGRMNGIWKSFSRFGDLSTEITYVDGVPEGRFVSYSSSGRVSWEGVHRNGKREGETTSYRDDGSLRGKNEYRNGVSEGRELIISQSGRVYVERTRRNGLLDGVETVFDTLTGNISIEREWVTGVREGFYRRYHHDGTLYLEGSFRGGKLHGTCTRYSTTGSVMETISFIVGRRDGTQDLYSKTGSEIVDVDIWKDGECIAQCESDEKTDDIWISIMTRLWTGWTTVGTER